MILWACGRRGYGQFGREVKYWSNERRLVTLLAHVLLSIPTHAFGLRSIAMLSQVLLSLSISIPPHVLRLVGPPPFSFGHKKGRGSHGYRRFDRFL